MAEEILKEEIKQALLDALPKISDGIQLAFVDKCILLGVSAVDHLQMIRESDLVGTLSPIQCRVFLQSLDRPSPVTSSIISDSSAASVSAIAENDNSSETDSTFLISFLPHDIKVVLMEKGKFKTSRKRLQAIQYMATFLINKNNGEKPNRAKMLNFSKTIAKLFPSTFCGGMGEGHEKFFQSLESHMHNRFRGSEKRNNSCSFSLLESSEVISDENFQELQNQAMNLSAEENFQILKKLVANEDFDMTLALDEWPQLFTEENLKSHFKEMTQQDLAMNLEKAQKDFLPIVLQFLQSKQGKYNDLKAAFFEFGQNFNLVILIKLLGIYFKEDYEQLIVKENGSNNRPPAHPCLVETVEGYSVVVDECYILHHIVDENSAVSVMFASYYIFDCCYPKSAAAILECLQRMVYGINPPSSASKLPKKARYLARVNGINNKVLKLNDDIEFFK